MDRFAMQFTLGYVRPEEEVAILTAHQDADPLETLEPCVTMADVLAFQQTAQKVRISEELKRYTVALVTGTRTAAGVQLGASPRASITLMKAAQAVTLFDGYDYVRPEAILELAVPVIAHRMVLEPQARFSGQTTRGIVEQIIHNVPVPA